MIKLTDGNQNLLELLRLKEKLSEFAILEVEKKMKDKYKEKDTKKQKGMQNGIII